MATFTPTSVRCWPTTTQTDPAGITPAKLPTAGQLDQLKASHQLDDQTFTAVGYGTVREDKTGGPHSLFLTACAAMPCSTR